MDEGRDGALRSEYQSRVWEGTWRNEKGEQGGREVGGDEGGDVAGRVVQGRRREMDCVRVWFRGGFEEEDWDHDRGRRRMK